MTRPFSICSARTLLFGLAIALTFSGVLATFGAAQDPGSKAGSQPEAAKPAAPRMQWTPPADSTIPEGQLGDSVRLGRNIFNDTPKYAEKYVGNKLSCSSCHVSGGTVPFGIPIVGLPGLFPMYRDREKQVITYEERIEQCFQRSENGHRLPNNSPEMVALVAYSQWLSQDQPAGKAFSGRGQIKLPALNGDPERGSKIYVKQCVLCHGANGAGKYPDFPALWGPDSYNEGAGLYGTDRMAPFIQYNMPQLTPGILTPQEAYDVAAYVHSMPHTPFDIKQHQ